MSININSEMSCRRAYLDYHLNGNSMGITESEMTEITQRWESRLSLWKASASKDENVYEIDDSEFLNAKAEGKKAAQEATGHDGKTGGQIAQGTGSAAVSAAGATTNIVMGGASAVGNAAGAALGKETSKKIAGLSFKESLKKGTGDGSKLAAAKFDAAQNVGAYVAAGIAIVQAALYWILQPNKKEKEACDALQGEMANSQAAVSDAQSEMQSATDEVEALSDEATDYNEEANDNIEEKKSEYDMYRQTFEMLKAKVDSGEQLTESEQVLYKELVGMMTEAGDEITETSEDATEKVGEIYDDIDSQIDTFDYSIETIGEVEGITDFAQNLDTTTRTMCYVEGASQTLNAASGFLAGARLMIGPWWNWIIGALAIGAGASSSVAAAQQFKWAGEVGTEIDMRKTTQDMNAVASDQYDVQIDDYQYAMDGVEGLELAIPDDIEAPDATQLPQTAVKKEDETEKKQEPSATQVQEQKNPEDVQLKKKVE